MGNEKQPIPAAAYWPHRIIKEIIEQSERIGLLLKGYEIRQESCIAFLFNEPMQKCCHVDSTANFVLLEKVQQLLKNIDVQIAAVHYDGLIMYNPVEVMVCPTGKVCD